MAHDPAVRHREALETVVVLILVLVWVAALLPIALKKRSEWELSSSISQFRQRRRLLVRLFGPTATVPLAPGIARSATPAWAPDPMPTDPAAPAPAAKVSPRAAQAARARRHALQARRRRTLAALLGTFATSLLLGAIPALRPLWDLAIVAALCSVAYVAALVWFRRAQELAAERERKVVELAARARQSAVAPIRPRPSFVIVEATS